ncbi:uncharacterized protein LOC118593858 [Onychomys torridus]|uniref:uncharacterized protein LOC118593858 n=1 Tax=Onychomys torridus TaxID=38674 RepID=UPI00167FC495|nr:uncharacterized protein LOC118593858 [Onychomys torridus]
MAEGKRLMVYTDSRYAFTTAHVHGEIYRRRGLLTSEGKEIKNKKEILDLLRALFLPHQLSIIHCPGHQKDDSVIARGNRLADLTARTVALQPPRGDKLLTLEAHLQALQLVQKMVWKPLADAYREQLNRPVVPHPFKIGDSVWVRRHQSKNLEPRWKGPYTVLLTTPTALKVDGIATWVQASHVKAAKEPDEAESTKTSTWKVQHSPNPLKIRLTRGSP